MYILMMVISLSLSVLILKGLSFDKGIYNDKGVKSLSGLRCLLAAIVAFSHVAHYLYSIDHDWIYNKDYFSWFSEGNFFVNAGKFGVLIFFMISAFLFYRLIYSERYSTSGLFTSRVKRIVPMFWFTGFVVFTIGAFNGELPDQLTTLKDFVMWMLFVGNYHIGDFNTSAVNAGVEWTLRIEWSLYASIPVVYYLNILTKRKHTTTLVLGSIAAIFAVGYGIRLNSQSYCDPRPVLGFATGFFCYRYASLLAPLKESKPAAALCVFLAAFSLLFTSNALFYLFFFASLSIIFAVACSGNSIFGILENRILMSIGEVSYSLYLMHGIVLYFMKKIPVFYLKESWLSCLLFCTVFFVVSFSLSKLTYLYIEKPFMKFKFRKPSLPFTPPPAAGM